MGRQVKGCFSVIFRQEYKYSLTLHLIRKICTYVVCQNGTKTWKTQDDMYNFIVSRRNFSIVKSSTISMQLKTVEANTQNKQAKELENY